MRLFLFMKSTLRSLFTFVSLATHVPAATCYVYVGSYTKGPEEGITLLKMDEATGKLENLGVTAAAPNPTFLTVDAKGEFLYAVHERQPGAVAAYRIDRTSGKLQFLNAESTKGDGPCHVCVDQARRNLIASNYGSGSVACLPIKADGSLAPASFFEQFTGQGPNPQRQEGPHAHGAYLSPDEKFALVADLGTDRIHVYHFDGEKGLLTKNAPPAGNTAPGAGPRHGTFSPDGSKFYIINELNNTITSFAWDAAKGNLTALQSVSTLEKPMAESSTAEIEFHPNHKVLYGSNRGHNSIARYAVDDAGRLTLQDLTSTTGPMPRHFAVHPSGLWMLAGNQKAETLITYAVDPVSGKLTLQGPPLSLRAPVCMVYLRIP